MKENPFENIGNFFKNHPIYILCSIIYYIIGSLLLGGKFIHFVIVFIFYFISLCICFSPSGEKILRIINKVRKIETRQEKEYLIPIFQEVYTKAKKNTPELPKIELCIIDNMNINACALGTHTIAITKGAMETLTEEQIKSVLAHEIAHIAYYDTIANQFTIIGNGLFSIFVMLLMSVLSLIEFIGKGKVDRGAKGLLYILVKTVIQTCLIVFMFIMQLAIAKNSRENENNADYYAYYIGYGEELIETLYLLEKISLGDNSTVIEKMLANHPRVTSRIEKLEELVE